MMLILVIGEKIRRNVARYQFTCLWEVPQSSRGTKGSLWSLPCHTSISSYHTSKFTLLSHCSKCVWGPYHASSQSFFLVIFSFNSPSSHSPPSHSFCLLTFSHFQFIHTSPPPPELLSLSSHRGFVGVRVFVIVSQPPPYWVHGRLNLPFLPNSFPPPHNWSSTTPH